MSSGNLIKENGFFFLNNPIIYHSRQINGLFTIYFIKEYMVYEMDGFEKRIAFNNYLFEAKYERRKSLEQKLFKEDIYSPFTNIRKTVGLYEINNSEISCSFIGENSDRPNVQVYLKRMWLPFFGTDYYLNVHDQYNTIVKSEKMTFCSYP